jgi:hypothetical protein
MSGTVTGIRHHADGSVTVVELPRGTSPSSPRPRPGPNWLPATKLLERITPEYAAIRKAAADALEAGQAQMSLWVDTLTAQGGCDLNADSTKAAKAGLISAGLLTQERADAVFAPMSAP